MITFPNAKINLGLSITEKRPDGYHNLETVFYPLPIEDVLEVTEKSSNDQPFSLTISGIELDGDLENNLVVKAYRLLEADFQLPPIDIHLHKNIPSGAGLGGGSADAAFMLRLLNEQFKLNLSNTQLENYASRLGADCAFFIQNKPIYAEGIGNLFSPISLSLTGYQYVIVKPNIFVSTRSAFSQITPRKPIRRVKEIIQLPIEEWKEYLHNDFEDSVFPQFPAIHQIKQQLYESQAIYASMSGSGSSVFGIFSQGADISELTFESNALVYTGFFK